MTDKSNVQFTPDNIDAQIDERLVSQRSQTPEDCIIGMLKQHYAPTNDHSQSLAHVWQRFIDQRTSPEATSLNGYGQQPDVTGSRPTRQNKDAPLRSFTSSTLSRRSGLMAAVVFLALIVSGMVMLPLLLHRSNQSAQQTRDTSATPRAPIITDEQTSYEAIPVDGGNAFLYRGTSVIKADQSQRMFSPLQFKAQSGKLVEVNPHKGDTKIWSYAGDLFSAPLLRDDVLYVPSQKGLDALRASDHTLLWHQNVLLTPFDVNNATFYAFGQDGGLEALRVSDGTPLWHSQYKLALGIEKDIVYVTGNFDYISALRASDGQLLWRSKLVDSSADVANGVVFLHTQSYGIRALSGKTGTLLWSNEHIGNVLMTQNGTVYASEKDGNSILALNANNGSIRWQYKTWTIHSVWAGKDIVYISTVQDIIPRVTALRASDGKFLWQAKTQGQVRLLKDEVLYLDGTSQDDSTSLLALRASDGTLLWQRNDIDHVYDSHLWAISGVVYAALTDNKAVVALNASNGAILARYAAGAL